MPTAREATTRLAELLRLEHHTLADFLVALSVFDRERRWVDLGFRSLFPFLTRELGLSKGAAYYRMTAAELVQRYPDVLAALRDGSLCLTSVVELSKVLTPDNLAEVLPRFFHLSKREAKEVTAELRPAPAPPLRTVVTAVPAAGVGHASDPGDPSDPGGGVDPGNAVDPGDPSGPGDAALNEVSTAASAVPAAAPSSAPRSMPPAVLVAPDAAPVVGPLDPSDFTSRAVQPANLVRASSSVPGVASMHTAGSAPGRGRRSEVEPLTADLSRLHVTVPRRLLEKLSAARDALSHSHPDASDADLLEIGLDLIVDRHRRRRGIGAKPRRPAASAAAAPPSAPGPAHAAASISAPPERHEAAPPVAAAPVVPGPPELRAAAHPRAAPAAPLPGRRSRHVPAAVWRAVWERDQGRCVWPVDGGGVCGSTRRLQLDHVDGFALGAPTTVDGCRLLCAVHNDLHARELYGDDVMDRCARPKGGRCSEPVARWGAFAAAMR